MKVQLLVAAMALGVCVGMPVKPEPRKFVYQVGYPSVRRYPVYPDRLFNADQAQLLVKMSTEKNKDIKNELMLPEGQKPDIMPLMKQDILMPLVIPELAHPEAGAMAHPEEETSTLSFLSVETEGTTTYRPVVTPNGSSPSSLLEETTSTGSSTTPSGFSFTPKPSSIQSESSVSSSFSSFSTGPISPVLTLIHPQSDELTPAEPLLPHLLSDNGQGDNALFTQPEDPAARESVSSSFAVFTESPEESTDTSMTTAMPLDEFMEEEQAEEATRMTDPTIAPLEEKTEEILEELAQSSTDGFLLEQTVTEATWEPVSQDIYTTEEIETF